MTSQDQLKHIRATAKRLARGKRILHHQALDIVATSCGYPHWSALVGAWDRGWRPTQDQLEGLNDLNKDIGLDRWIGSVEASRGTICGEPYQLESGFDYVLLHGSGWAIYLGHAPSEAPEIEQFAEPNPLDDEGFFGEALRIANAAADKVREAISRDWPRRSTQPDAKGRVVHPLFKGGVAAEWHCCHCERKSSGADMAANMWHCPKCNATPLDMHAVGWWRGDA